MFLHAGPGTGKTSLLAEYAQICRDVVWYQARKPDVDPVVFLTGVAAAIEEQRPTMSQAAVQMIRSLGASALPNAVSLLCDGLASLELDGGLVILIDDSH